MANYRFYILNRLEQITKAQVAECEGEDEIERAADSLLAEHQASAAVEVWERDKVVYRTSS